MGELDFDELDKAVNSLMADVSATKKEAKKDEETVLDLDTPAPIVPTQPAPGAALDPAVVADVAAPTGPEEPVASSQPIDAPMPENAAQEVAETLPVSEPAKPASPAAKRRGQFMDMIHPSADMKTQAFSARREGVTIQPSSTPSSDSMETEAVTAPDNTQELSNDSDQSGEAESPLWSDSIDLVGDKEATHSEAGVPDTSETSQNADELPVLTEQLGSPFLANTKVEKRPLGGSPQVASSLDEAASADDASEQLADDPQVGPVQPDSQDPVLPAELHTDLMALESSNTGDGGEQSATDASDTDAVEPPVSSTPTAEQVTQPSSGSGSIPQQYKEQASSGDTVNTAIYDTSTHHQPLDVGEHKKHSPLKWVVAALVILIIGAVAGAAYFYFTTNS